MKVLGVSAYSGKPHDNAASLIIDGKICYGESEERVTRKKHDGSFAKNVIDRALNYKNIKKEEIDYVGVPAFELNIINFFLHQNKIPIIIFLLKIAVKNPLYLISKLVKFLDNSFKLSGTTALNVKSYLGIDEDKVIFIDHHLAHAASGYYISGIKRECLTVVLDGWGVATDGFGYSGAIYRCHKKIKLIERIPAAVSLGAAYSVATYALGFKPGDGEGKTMGLAAYGEANRCFKAVEKLFPRFQNGQWISEDKTAWLIYQMLDDKNIFLKTSTGQRYRYLLNKFKRADIAAAVQKALEDNVVNFFEFLLTKYKINRFVCSGGVFLNVKMTQKILEKIKPEVLFIPMAPNDVGLSLGAALEISTRQGKNINFKYPQTAALGISFKDKDIIQALKKYEDRVVYEKLVNPEEKIVDRLLKGKIIGLFQGRAEFGPRALGNRSVLADPRDEKVRDYINKNMKGREWFMPFAPSILRDSAHLYLSHNYDSPYMDKSAFVEKKMIQKLVAATHVDNSVRPQYVYRKNNQLFYDIIEKFYHQSGVAALLNTSFNKHGLPIVDKPEDAIDHLLWGCIDELFIESYWVRKALNKHG